MNITDYKGRLLARQGNLQAQLAEHRKQVLCLEADLAAARKAADITDGALQGTALALADLEATATPPPAKGAG